MKWRVLTIFILTSLFLTIQLVHAINSNLQATVKVIEIQELNGDVNNDCIVNIFDLAMVGLAYGSVEGDDNWNENADLNDDGKISIFDLATVGLNYGREC